MSLLSVFSSNGTKRRIASVLSVILGLAALFPGTAGIVNAVQVAASLFGVTGLVHAAAVGTLPKEILATLSSVSGSIILAAHFVPALQPLVAPLQYIAALLGAAALGAGKAN